MGLSSVGAITERRAAVSLNSAIILEYMATGDFLPKGYWGRTTKGVTCVVNRSMHGRPLDHQMSAKSLLPPASDNICKSRAPFSSGRTFLGMKDGVYDTVLVSLWKAVQTNTGMTAPLIKERGALMDLEGSSHCCANAHWAVTRPVGEELEIRFVYALGSRKTLWL